jgi:hypothetical protein
MSDYRTVPDRTDALRVGRAILDAHGQWEKENTMRGSQDLWGEQHVILLGQAAMLAAAPALSASPAPAGDQVESALRDPATVHINMLRGGIAKPTPAQIGHLYRGDEAAEVIREVARQNPDAARAVIAAMQPGWRDMESAPKDGTVIDVWRSEGGRETVFWGYPSHSCGEMGSYCDSDWHAIRTPGWVCVAFNEFVGGNHNPFTHWQPRPAPPGVGG